MNRIREAVLFLLFFSLVFVFLVNLQSLEEESIEDVYTIIDNSCSVSGCHQGKRPPRGLNLERDQFLDSVINIPSQEVPSLKLVDTEDPEKSYLLMKIIESPEIKGSPMPLFAPSLSSEDIQTIQDWIKSLKEQP
jgi:hypothetical protein